MVAHPAFAALPASQTSSCTANVWVQTSCGSFRRRSAKLVRVKNVVSSSKLTDSEPSCDKNNKEGVVFNRGLQSLVVSSAWLPNRSWKNYDGPKNKTGSLSHHLPDALCQQVRALIGLRLPNCAVINEWFYSVPSSRLILLYLFGFWAGGSWAQCERLAFSREFIFLRMRLWRSTGRSEGRLHGRESGATAGRPRRVRVVDCTNVSGEGAQNVTFACSASSLIQSSPKSSVVCKIVHLRAEIQLFLKAFRSDAENTTQRSVWTERVSARGVALLLFMTSCLKMFKFRFIIFHFRQSKAQFSSFVGAPCLRGRVLSGPPCAFSLWFYAR